MKGDAKLFVLEVADDGNEIRVALRDVVTFASDPDAAGAREDVRASLSGNA